MLDSPVFAASFAFWLLAMGLLNSMFAVCTQRTNACLAVNEWSLTIVFGLLAATFWTTAEVERAVVGFCRLPDRDVRGRIESPC